MGRARVHVARDACPPTPRCPRPSSPSTTACPPRTSPSTCRRWRAPGVLETVKGPRGGYRLARPPAEITLLDVVEAIDGDEPAFRCTEIRRRGPTAMPAREYTKLCGIHAAFDRADEAWRAELRRDDDRRPLHGRAARRAAARARKGRPLAAGSRALTRCAVSGRRAAACRGWPCCAGPSACASSSSCS